MTEIFKKYKKIIIIVAVLIVAFIIYSYWSGGSNNNNSAVLTSTGAGGVNNTGALSSSPQIGRDFLNQLSSLQNVSLDSAIFTDPRFLSLQDYSQPIPDEPQGRPNPFAPIGVDVSNGPTFSATGTNNNVNFTIQSAPKTGTTSSPSYGSR